MPVASDFLASNSAAANVSLCPASFLSNQKQTALAPSHDSTIIQGPFKGLTRTTSPGLNSAMVEDPPVHPIITDRRAASKAEMVCWIKRHIFKKPNRPHRVHAISAGCGWKWPRDDKS